VRCVLGRRRPGASNSRGPPLFRSNERGPAVWREADGPHASAFAKVNGGAARKHRARASAVFWLTPAPQSTKRANPVLSAGQLPRRDCCCGGLLRTAARRGHWERVGAGVQNDHFRLAPEKWAAASATKDGSSANSISVDNPREQTRATLYHRPHFVGGAGGCVLGGWLAVSERSSFSLGVERVRVTGTPGGN